MSLNQRSRWPALLVRDASKPDYLDKPLKPLTTQD
jgi:hypothetical protein